MKRWRVYLITCTPTGMQYVGQTRQSIAVRWAQHIQEARNFNKSWPLATALREYDEDDFTIEVLAEFPTQTGALTREVEEVERRQTRSPCGYNLTKGGHGTAGIEKSTEWRAKHSTILKARASEGRRWGTNSSEGQRAVWRSYTPEQRAARLAKSGLGLALGPRARWDRTNEKQSDLFGKPQISDGLSLAEVRLRFSGGCSVCNIPPFRLFGFMCEHAASLTQVEVNRLR